MGKPKKFDFAETQKLKKKAREAFTKGKHKKALHLFLQLSSQKPGDLRIKTRVGDLLMKLKRQVEAITVYKSVAANYASQGMLIQAIAVNKMILQIDANNPGIRQDLAALYSKKNKVVERSVLARVATVIQPIQIKEKPGKPVAKRDLGQIKSESSTQKMQPEVSPDPIEIVVGMDELLEDDDEGNKILEISGKILDFSGAINLAEIAEISLPPTLLFSDLEEKELERVLGVLKRREVQTEEDICQEGAPGDSIFIISEGSLQVSSQDSSGNPLLLATLKEGDFFGEFGFFSDHKRHATVRGLEETVLLELERPDLESIIKEIPRVAQVLEKFYQRRLLETLLLKSQIFRHLNTKERVELAKRFELVSCPKETLIMKEGDRGDSMYLIQEGKLQVSTKDVQGKSVLLAVLKEGDFCGEFSVLTGAKRTADVVAMVDAKLLRLSKESAEAYLAENPQAACVLQKLADERVEGTIKVMSSENPPQVAFEYDEVRSTMV